MSVELARKIEKYVSHRLPAAEDVRVSGVDRIHGGASRETFRFRLQYAAEGGPVDRLLILRRDPPSSLIETDRRSEFEAYKAFYPTEVPVPEMVWLEVDESWLEHPGSGEVLPTRAIRETRRRHCARRPNPRVIREEIGFDSARSSAARVGCRVR